MVSILCFAKSAFAQLGSDLQLLNSWEARYVLK